MKTRVKEGRHLARQKPGTLRVTKSEGSYLFDENGKRYVDFMMGWCVGNLGWGNAVVTRKGKAFTGPDYVQPALSYKPWDDLAELLVSITPGKLSKCFRATGGSEAVDLALQAALLHTGRTKLMSLEGSYHGNSIGGLSVGDSEVRKRCKALLPGCHKIKPPLDEAAVKKIRRLLERGDVAAFIMEPISINLGVLIPSAEFMSDLQRLCREHGTLLIMDEVATGFGRTGKMFASEHYPIKPDILCLAKAITNGAGGILLHLRLASAQRGSRHRHRPLPHRQSKEAARQCGADE
jgi:adenosylmethionine-8-amino-7-oxononanoate aminotransferase